MLDKQTPQPVALDLDTRALEGTYKGAVRGDPAFSVEVKSISDGITMQSENSEEPDTLDVYVGNNTWSQGNTRIVIKNDEIRYINSSSYWILKKE